MGVHPSNYLFYQGEYIFLIDVTINLTYQNYMLFVSIQGDELQPTGRLVENKRKRENIFVT